MSNLREIRESKNVARKELSEKSGVSLRMIEKYEMEDRDINKAQAITVYKLAQALESSMENLIEIKKEVEE